MRRLLTTKHGFTLIEILVVLAISMILMGLVLYPVVQSFQMTRRAQAMTDAQDAARAAMEQLSRELGEAMYVFDNSVRPVTVYDPPFTAGNEGPIQLPVRHPGGVIECFTLPNGKIDLILPKITMHCVNPAHPEGQPRDYPRGDEAWPPCPVCTSQGIAGADNVEAKPTIPLEQDVTVVRYFIGLRYNDPTVTANPGPDQGLFGWKSPWIGDVELGEENQAVLYRVEFDPNDPNHELFPPHMPVSQRLTDPIFFYRPESCKRWAEIARVIGVGKYEDLVVAQIDSNGAVTSVEPTVTFRFSAVENDTFSGTYSQDKNFEYPDAVPTIFEAAYGYWISGAGITVTRTQQQGGEEVTVEYTTEYDSNNHLVIVKRTGAGAGTPEFDITDYLQRLVSGDLTNMTKPGGAESPEIAFIFDYVTYLDSSGSSLVALNFNRGVVNFALAPPRPKGSAYPCIWDPYIINDDFKTAYSKDRGSARRMAVLPTFDDTDAGYVAGARVVPGSEKVIGPDMTPPVTRELATGGTTHYISRRSTPITYERVPLALGDPGLNQYKIDYDNGIIYFSSVYDQNLPDKLADGSAAQIVVDYRICLNKSGDVVKGDYTTKSLVNIHLGMRMFDPDSGKPHTVELNNSVKVRNALR